ncbi:MAG: hypothetical protein J6S71_00745 [Clostridia bacterium]|nr:hypothetical protein [Clostridia bacterium]
MGIGEYFLSVIAASVISALIAMFFGDDKAALSKGINTACSLFLLCVIVSPISSLISRAKDNLDFEEIVGNYESAFSSEEALYASLGAVSGERIEEVLRTHIAERAGIDEGDLEVRAEVSVSDGAVILKRVILCLYSDARWSDPRVLRDAVGELTDAECLIINGE